MRILFYGESPICETGAGRVDLHVLDTIVAAGHSVDMVAFDHFWGDSYDHERYPYPIVDTTNVQEARAEIEKRDGQFDILFISADMHVPNILIELVAKYPSIVLAAIDGQVLDAKFISSLSVALCPVVYSQYSYQQVLGVLPQMKEHFHCTPLGCEPEVFYPVTIEERTAYRKQAFDIDDDTFLVSITNRNAMRKDIARGIKAFKLFHDRVPNSKLYLHMQRKDLGGDVALQAELLGLKNGEFFCTNPEYNAVGGYNRATLNRMYNAADVGISTSRGEGWGLTTTEYMAAGTPFVGPNNTTFPEILGRQGERGYLVESGGKELWTVAYGQDDAPRPLTSVTDMAHRLEYIYFNRDDAHRRAARARQWTQEHTWLRFRNQWTEILTGVEAKWQNARLSLA